MDPNYHSHVRADIFPHLQKGGRFLDVGGGDGATAAAIRAAGLSDSIGVVDLVQPAHAADLDFAYRGDLNDPRLLEQILSERGPFETILCLDILEHFVDPWTMIERLHGMLAPGGAIVASIPNVRHYSALLPLLFKGKWQYESHGILDRTHLRFFTRETAIQLMGSSGLTVELVEPLLLARKRDLLINRATFGLTKNFLSLQYVVRARKARS